MEELVAGELSQGDEVVRDAVLHSFAAEGTRWRPLFTMLAAQFGPTPDAWEVTVSGAATKLIHLATCCHDEVVEDGQGASSADFRSANNIAILAGDHRFAAASRLGSRLGQVGFQVIADAFAELITGKMRETIGAAPGADPIAHYLQCAEEKTGSLVGAAGRLGSTFAGVDEEHSLRLARLGRLVGSAWQISDESNDIAGALRRGVHSLPVLFALAEDGHAADRLRVVLAAPFAGEDGAEALDLIRSSPGIATAKQVLAGYARQAQEELAALPQCAGSRALSTLIDDLATGADATQY